MAQQDDAVAERPGLDEPERQDHPAGFSESDHAAVAYTAAPRGVAALDLDAEQREMLRELLGTYLDRVPPEVSPLSRYDEDAALDAVYLAWAGPLEPGAPHYYRVQGPQLLLEWDKTQRGANHAHSVWRDPGADFGLDVLAQHRGAHHSRGAEQRIRPRGVVDRHRPPSALSARRAVRGV